MRKRDAHDDAYLRLASTRLTGASVAAVPRVDGAEAVPLRRSVLLSRLALIEPREPRPEAGRHI